MVDRELVSVGDSSTSIDEMSLLDESSPGEKEILDVSIDEHVLPLHYLLRTYDSRSSRVPLIRRVVSRAQGAPLIIYAPRRGSPSELGPTLCPPVAMRTLQLGYESGTHRTAATPPKNIVLTNLLR